MTKTKLLLTLKTLSNSNLINISTTNLVKQIRTDQTNISI